MNAAKTILGWAACALVVYAIAWPFYRAIVASGRIEYCYVSSYATHVPTLPDVISYNLIGFRDWREDRVLARNMSNLEQVKVAAATYGCELR